MNIHIHRAPFLAARTKRMHCLTCAKRRTFFGWFQEWYGWHVTCLGCGDQWEDGEMLERPFMRGWRAKNIETAKNLRKRLAGLPTTPRIKP